MFGTLIGQEAVREHFSRLLGEGTESLHHAYLLVGEHGLGKRAFAQELGALIVAGGEEGDVSRRAAVGLHPDLSVVEREGDLIRLEQVKPLVSELSLRPFLASDRVWVIDEADKLHPAAANKLLKSLEEPPAHVFFLLVSDEPEAVLPTIVSRCEVVQFSPVPRDQLGAWLQTEQGFDEGAAAAIARLAGGSPGRARRLAEDYTGPRSREQVVSAAFDLLGGDRSASARILDVVAGQTAAAAAIEADLARALSLIESTVPDERDRKAVAERARNRAKRDKTRATREVALEAVDDVVSAVRDAWVAAVGDAAVVLNVDHTAQAAAASSLGAARLERALTAAGRVRASMRLNVDLELGLRALFCQLEEVLDQ